MIKGVIFDMDGVIIDSEPVYKEIEKSLYKELGIYLTEAEIMDSMGKGTHQWWCEVVNKYNLKEDPKVLSDREDNTYLDYLFDDTAEKVMMPGLDGLLKNLKAKGIKTAVASASVPAAIEQVIGLFGLADYFDALVSGTQVPQGKPAPDIFLKAAELIDVPSEYCLVVEDSQNGVLAAKRAGMKAAAYLSAPEGFLDFSQADYQFKKHAELMDMAKI